MSELSGVFELSSRYVDEFAAADPVAATGMGVSGHDDRLTDYSGQAQSARAQLARDTLKQLAMTVAVSKAGEATDSERGSVSDLSAIDSVAALCLQERLECALQLHDSGENVRTMNVLTSPVSDIRAVFDLMPTNEPEARESISHRLAAIPGALATWRSALDDSIAQGLVSARRQALAVADQCDVFGDTERGWFTSYVGELDTTRGDLDAGSDRGDGLDDLAGLAAVAEAAYRETGTYLRDTYAPHASEIDAVGPERYAMHANVWNGAQLDLESTWLWGWQELDRIRERMTSVAAALSPGLAVSEVRAYLDSNPAYVIEGSDALLEFLTDLTERTTTEMEGRYFDIDPRIRQCDVKLAAEGGAAAPYYVPPSEDLSRAGSTWYPTLGHTSFPRWWAVSVWYHEAVPGHHLQCATSALERDRQSRFQRLAGWTSGYGEGWALYAERLMDELGYFDDPGIEMGFLSNQALRAARVVLDIGAHLELVIPTGRGELSGQIFRRASMVEFLQDQALLAEDFARSEADRYLGLPGQAISYKVGEKVWLDTREAARGRLGADFDLKDWHSYGLRLGPMGLDPFAQIMGGYTGTEVLA